jgi:hypothetical protein
LFEASLPNSLGDPLLKKIHQKKRAGGVTQGVDSEFKPQYTHKKRANAIKSLEGNELPS